MKGKTTGSRVLAEGKMEGSAAGAGNILGNEATEVGTVVFTWVPSGIMMAEGNSVFMAAEGEVVMAKTNGISWSTGKGLKRSARELIIL